MGVFNRLDEKNTGSGGVFKRIFAERAPSPQGIQHAVENATTNPMDNLRTNRPELFVDNNRFAGQQLLPAQPGGQSAEDIASGKASNPEALKLIKARKPYAGTPKSPADKVAQAVSDFTMNAVNSAALGAPDLVAEAAARNEGINPDNVTINKDSVAAKAGDIAGQVLPISKAYGLTEKVVGAATKGVKSKIAKNAIRGAAAGAAYETAKQVTDAALNPNSDQTVGDRAKAVGESALLFSAGDAAISGLIKVLAPGVKKALQALSGQKDAPQAVHEILALPEPKPRGNVNSVEAPPVIEGRVAPTKARIAEASNPYRQKFENLIATANQMKFTPGRELEELQSLWSTMAGPKDPGLNQLIDLAYPPAKQVTQDALQRGRMKQIVGLGPKVESNAGAPVIPGEAAQPASKYAAERQAIKQEQPLNSTPEPQPVPGNTLKQIDNAAPQNIDYPFENVPPAKDANPATGNPIEDVAPHPKIDQELEQEAASTVNRRLRDNVSSYADRLIQEAKDGLKRMNSNPIDVYTKFAVGHMLKGAVKLADVTELLVKQFGEEIRPKIKEIWSRAKEDYAKTRAQIQRDTLGLSNVPIIALRDLSKPRLNFTDVYRNFRDVFGENYPAVKKAILDPFDQAKGDFARMQKSLFDELKYVTDTLGIKKGSKESALVQQYGEGMIDLPTLQERSPDKWENIVKADRWFREKYNNLLDEVNNTVSDIYPNQPEKLVPKRQDYYRHFREVSGLTGLKNLFETPAQIDPNLAGVSPFTQPKTKWASFKQRRGMGPYKNDAVGGFLDYIPAAAYAIHIDPQIGVFRSLAKALAEVTTDSRNVNYFIQYLRNFANDLAGKTSPFFGRAIEESSGRKFVKALQWLDNRVKGNIILGNVGSVVAQAANIPNGIAFAKQYAAPGLKRTVISVYKPNLAMQESNFLMERYINDQAQQFNIKLIEQPRKFATWMMSAADRLGTSFIWNSAYEKGIGMGVPNPVRYADEETRRLVAGRGVGEVPLFQKDLAMKIFAPFQLEVTNLWHVMKDFVSAKDFGGIAILFLANYLFNNAAEKVRGSRITFDPINAAIDAFNEPDLNPLERGGRIVGEVLSNLPFGQTIASIYPEYGTKQFGVQLPTRKQLFGSQDPTRFGTGPLVAQSIADPVFKLLFPFGGNQVKKLIQGLDAVARGGKYTENVLTTGPTIEHPKIQFQISDSPTEIIRAALFGPAGTKSGQEYYDNNRRPLSETQTKQYLNSSDPNAYYNRLMKSREVQSLRDKISKIQKDREMKVSEKKAKIEKLVGRLKEKLAANQ